MSEKQTGIGATPQAQHVGAIDEIGIGMLGYAFMGKAHSNAFRKIAYMTWPPPLMPRLVAIAGRNEEAVADAAQRYGYERWTTDWRDIVADPAIGLFDNGGPNSLHAEPTIAAAEAGKHVLCEKPLGRTAEESHEIWQRVAATGVKHLCAFNYRFVPAVRLAREMIEAGELGEIRHFRGRYLQDWGDDPTPRHVALPAPTRPDPERSATSARTSSTSRASSSARSRRSRRSCRRSFRAGRSTTRSRRPSSSRAAPSERSSRRASPSAGATRSSGRSTARRDRSHSTWSDSTSCRCSGPTGTARAGSRPCSCREADHPFWELLVASRAHHRLGRDVRARDPPPAARDRRGHRRRPVRSDVRGRLSRRRGVRRDRPLERERPARNDLVPLSCDARPGRAAVGPTSTSVVRDDAAAPQRPALIWSRRATVSSVTAKSRMTPVTM